MTGSADMSCRIYSLDPLAGFKPVTLSGHRSPIVGCFFSADMAKVYSVSKDGSAFTWAFAQAEAAADGGTAELAFDRETATSGRWKLEAKNYFRQDHAKVISASFFAATSLLVCGFSSGIFALYEMPDFTNIHSLSISQQKVSASRTAPYIPHDSMHAGAAPPCGDGATKSTAASRCHVQHVRVGRWTL